MSKAILSNILILFVLSSFVWAQEQDDAHMNMAPPPALEDEFLSWMVGEWRGTSTSAMGKTTDYMKCEMGFGGQFLIMNYKSKNEDGSEMSGMGLITHSMEGKLVGYWVDSWRTMSEGEGTRDGMTSTMFWKTAQGTFIRTTEKVDENTMKVSGLMKNADGSEITSNSELTRVMVKKSY